MQERKTRLFHTLVHRVFHRGKDLNMLTDASQQCHLRRNVLVPT